jgi:ADP-heptose:LPS heptosyltransferase
MLYMFLSFLIGFRYRKKLGASAEIKIKKIIVFKPDHIGDFILALPVFENLRHHMSQAKIIAVVSSAAKNVLDSSQSSLYVDEICGYDAKFFARSNPPSGFEKSFKLLRKLLRTKADLIVDLRNTPLSLTYALFSGAKYRFDRSSRRILSRIKGEELKEHEVEINLDVIQSGGVPARVRHPRFFIKDADRDWVKNLFEDLKIKDAAFLVAMHAGAPEEARRWPFERFAQLAQELHSRYGAKILLVGGRDEQKLAAEIMRLAPDCVSNLVGKTDFRQLASVLKSCDLFIGNNSGPMHLAAAVEAKTIGLHGPLTLERFKPYGQNAITIRGKANCPPCRSKTCNVFPRGCLDQIQVEDVLQAASKLLNIDRVIQFSERKGLKI